VDLGDLVKVEESVPRRHFFIPKHERRLTTLSKFFNLPLELRLEVYSHCTSFGLLMLAHTSKFLRTEINRHPRIIMFSYGFRADVVSYYWDIATAGVVYVSNNTHRHNEKTEFRNHSIALVEHLINDQEVRIWRHLYYGPPKNPQRPYELERGKGWYVCITCLQVVPEHAIGYNLFDCKRCDDWNRWHIGWTWYAPDIAPRRFKPRVS
jgi:hypothetical protein